MITFFNLVKKSDGSKKAISEILHKIINEDDWIEMTSKKDIQKISTFLCQMNHMNALKDLLLRCFKRPDKTPGDALFFFISINSNIDINSSVISELDNEYSFFKTYLCPYSLNKDLYSELLSKQFNVYFQKYNKTKEDLIDKLQFARSQRLEVEVKKTLEKLIEAFPEDPSFVEEKGRYFEKEAAKVIDKSSKAFANSKNMESLTPIYTPLYNAEDVYNVIKGEFSEQNFSYLLEIFLIAGEDEIAIKILNEHEKLRKTYFWDHVEILIYKKRFLEALAQIKEMTELKSNDDEFNYYYFTSVCLWSLNDKKTALETMKSIAKVRPQFRQTQIYLNLWQQHDEVA